MTRFEWDPAKEKSNLQRHRLSFTTAARVFTDPFAMCEQGIENGELRWKTIGLRVVAGRPYRPLRQRRYRSDSHHFGTSRRPTAQETL
jgi:hypothetical protein